MRMIREVLRLRFESKLSMGKIGHSCRLSSSTVSDMLFRFNAAGLTWPLSDELNDAALENLLYRSEPVTADRPDGCEPDWNQVLIELRKSKNVTLALIWQEYKADHPGGYAYSWFCENFAKFRARLDPPMRQTHRFGEKCFIDYSGETLKVVDARTGEILNAELFVAVLGASNFTFAEATWSQKLPDWLGSHVRMFEFFGGLFELAVPDNLKSGVTKADYYEPDINPAYNELARHYRIAVLPARKHKPKDKAKVENGVLIAQRWIVAALRNRTFYTLDSLNEAIAELLDRLNDRRFQKMEGSRRSQFELYERPHLRPLPAERYYYAAWKNAKVNIDYHIDVDGHFYSVPYQLIHEYVDVRLTASTVEVLHNGVRVASHRVSLNKGGHTTLTEHMPPRHAKMLEWTPERVMAWAQKVGPSTRQLTVEIMARRDHPQQGFRSCLGILRLSKKYGAGRIEDACRRAVTLGAFSYQSIKSILEKKLDSVPLPGGAPTRTAVQHDNVRGSDYYAQDAMSTP